MTNEETQLLVLLNHYKLTATLVAAKQLGVLDSLMTSDVAVTELAQKCRCSAPELQRLLYGLQLLGLVECAEGRVRCTGLGWSTAHGELAPHVEMLEDYVQAWRHLTDAVREPCEDQHRDRIRGKRICDHRARRAYQEAMRANTAGVVPLVVEAAPEQGTLVDLGGGYGHILREVLAQLPKLKGVLVDVPPVLGDCPGAPTHVERWVDEQEPRLRYCMGSFFELSSAPLHGKTCYLLSNVLHDWDDEYVHHLLASVAEVASPNSRLLIVERLVQPTIEVALAMADLHMMVVHGGRQRTLEEMAALLAQHGWKLGRVITKNPVTDFTLIEGVRSGANE